jgi:PAS domain S-box-containing protein
VRDVYGNAMAENTDEGDGPGAAETLLRGMADPAFLLDVAETDGGYRFTFRRSNPAHRRQTGATDVCGQTPRDLLGDEAGAALVANCRRCVERGEPVRYEQTLRSGEESTRAETRLAPAGEEPVTRVVGVTRPVDGEPDAASLRLTTRRLRTVLETMSAAAFLKDTDGRYVVMNRACRELFGVDEGETAGLTDTDLLPPETAEQARRDDRRVVETGETIELEERVPSASGDTVRLTRKSPVYDADGEIAGVCGVSTDITDQKRRERRLERLRKRFELVVEGANLGVWDWDVTTDEVAFNDRWARMLGYAPEAVEPRLGSWLDRVHPDDLDEVEAVLDAHLAGETDRYDTEHRIRTADGGWKWVRDIGRVVERDADGDPVRVVGVHVDVDERKSYERTLERQRDDLEVLNQIVRHDVRNALQHVLAYGDILRDGAADEEAVRKVLAAAREAVDITQTAADVTELLLRSDTDRTPVALPPVLEEQVDAVRGDHDRAVVSVERPIPTVRVVADDMLGSVFRNLLGNALVHNDEQLPEVAVSATAEDDTVRVRVADNGPGIDDERKGAIFEQGERGLDSEGTGLGLYLVRTLVERYGGAVWVEDNDPKGSVFVVELQRAG